MFGNSNVCLRAVVVTVIMVCMHLSVPSAYAQRTMNGQSMITVSAVSSMLRPLDKGTEIGYGQYLLGSFWNVSAEGVIRKVVTSGDTSLKFIDVIFSGGYMYRLVGTRSRNISLYAGGEAFLGFEIYDPMNELPASIDTGLPSGSFLYGITPQFLAEFFLTGKLALVVGCSAPVNFSSPITKVRPNLSLGLRMNI